MAGKAREPWFTARALVHQLCSNAASGERGRAIRHYEDWVELLDEELGARPAPETRALHERLRAGEEA